MNADISIVIPVYNEEKHIRKVIRALFYQDYDGALEIIVVDGNSSDNTVSEVLSECQSASPNRKVILLNNGERCIPRSLNIGINSATGNVIVRLDGHTYPPSNYVSQMVQALKTAQYNGIVGGRWEITQGRNTVVSAAIAVAVAHPFGIGNATYRTYKNTDGALLEVDTVPFGAFQKSLWEVLGGYDTHMLANEDYDFIYRAKQIGYRILLVPNVVLCYVARGSLPMLWWQYIRYGYWVAHFFMKHKRIPAYRKIAPVSMVSIIGVALLIHPWLALEIFALHVCAAFAASLLYCLKLRGRWKLFLPLILIFVSLHWSYGLGNAIGIITKFVLPRVSDGRRFMH